MTITADEFMRRFLLHVLSDGFHRIRHFGLIANNGRKERLALTRELLNVTPDVTVTEGKHPYGLTHHAVLSYILFATGDRWKFDGPGDKETVTVKPILRSNSGDTCFAAARKHRGGVFQSSFMISTDLQNGTLVELMPQ